MRIKLIPEIFVRLAKDKGIATFDVLETLTPNDKKLEGKADTLLALLLADMGILRDFGEPDLMTKQSLGYEFNAEELQRITGAKEIPADFKPKSLTRYLKFEQKDITSPIYCTVNMRQTSERTYKEVLCDLLKIYYSRQGMEFVNTDAFKNYLAE